MVKGPLGLPRVTNIGPFTETEAEQEYSVDINEDVPSQEAFLDREISSIHNIDIDSVRYVDAKLIVREKIPDEADGVVDKIKREVDIATRENDVATMTYWMKKDIGRIGFIKTDDEFQNMGIATKIKRREIQRMKDYGVEIIYTDVISQGGYRLAKRTGFKPITQAEHMLQHPESQLNFNGNRGTMYKYI